MDKAEQREFHIDDWTIEELQSLFDDPAGENQLHTRSTAAIESATKKGDIALARFLRGAVAKLRRSAADPVWTTQLSAAAAAALGEQYYPNGVQTVAVTGPARGNTVKILTNEEIGNTRAPAERGALNQQTIFSSEANQGTINPILRQEFERILVVDSKYRPAILPHPKGVYSLSSTTNYHANLSEVLHNVVSLKLQSITVPRVWDNFSDAVGNTVIGVSSIVEGTETISWFWVPNTYFDPAQPEWATLPSLHKFDASQDCDLTLSKDNSTHLLKLELQCGPEYHSHRLVVFASDMPPAPSSACRMNSTINGNLAASLGFGAVETSAVPSSTDLHSFIVYGQPFGPGGVITADMPLDLHPLRYFLVILDDFNTNRINNSLVGLAGAETKIQPPASGFRQGSPASCPYVATDPRTRTQSQLYSANARLQSVDMPDASNSEPCPSNVLALCPVPGKAVKFGEMLTLTGTSVNSTGRMYFGPIDLQKIHVKLLDNAGNYVDLQGRDWSMSLVVTQLYQY